MSYEPCLPLRACVWRALHHAPWAHLGQQKHHDITLLFLVVDILSRPLACELEEGPCSSVHFGTMTSNVGKSQDLKNLGQDVVSDAVSFEKPTTLGGSCKWTL